MTRQASGNTDMDGIKVEPADTVEGRYVVRGPYERDYGRLHYGWVDRNGRAFEAGGADGRAPGGRVPLGTFPTLAKAGEAVAAWATLNLTAEALSNEFEGRTAGGRPVSFLRRAAGSIVATYTGKDGRRVSTSWSEDGTCELYQGMRDTDSRAMAEELRLVRREPKPEVDEAEEPAAPRF